MIVSRLQRGATLLVAALGMVALTGAAASAQVLQGDCNDNGEVSIGELVRCANIFNSIQALAVCPACDQNGDLTVSIGEVQGAANCFLSEEIDADCRAVTPPPTPEQTPTPSNTVPPTATDTPVVPPTATNTVPPPDSPTPVPTNTPEPTSTPAPTNTDLPTSTATAQPTSTPQPTSTATPVDTGTEFLVKLLGGGGTSTGCRGTCPAGTDAGKSCTLPIQNGTCQTPKTCTGGRDDGKSCTTNANCRDQAPCQGTCSSKSWKAGQKCTAGTDCPIECPNSVCTGPGKCGGGAFNNQACTNGTQCNSCDPNKACTAAGVPMACCTGSGAGTCVETGSCAFIQSTLFPIILPVNGVCFPRTSVPDVLCTNDDECASTGRTCRFTSLNIAVGPPKADGTRDLGIDQNSFFLPPAVVSGVGTACITAGADGVGVLDCDGGAPGLNYTLSQDHNTTPDNVCAGGPRLGLACAVDTECPPTPGDVFPCVAGACSGGSRKNDSCSGDANCPGNYYLCNTTNDVGFPNDLMCTNSVTQPSGNVDEPCIEGNGVCSGGTRDGLFCRRNGGALENCPGGTCSLCSTNGLHDGVCNSAVQIEVDGTLRPGDAVVTLPLAITLLSSTAAYGPDQLPCTADDIVSSPPAAVPVVLSTGLNQIKIYDANNVGGQILAPGVICSGKPCVASTSGSPIDCSALSNPDKNGALNSLTLGGGFPALDVAAGDISTTFRFQVGSSTPIN